MPVPESSGVDLGDIPSWLALVLSVGSLLWQWRSEFKSSRLEKCSQKIQHIEAFERSLNEVRVLAVAYWMASEHEGARDGLMLVHHLRAMARDAKRHKEILWDTVERDTLMLKMRTTGGEFQRPSRVPMLAVDPFVVTFMKVISDMASRIKDSRDRVAS